MRTGKRLLCWTLLLWKRLYKKTTFLILLLMIPALVLGYGLTTQEDSGLMVVALATKAVEPDELTLMIFDKMQESEVIRYIRCDNPQQAQSLVEAGKADVAWIFEEDLETKIYDFAAHRSRKYAFVTILEPENRVELKLAREVLSGILFPYGSEALYLTYIRENAPELDHLGDEQLLQYYRNLQFSDEMFLFTDLEGNPTENQETDYLLTPVRGMLAVVMVLAGLATAMYYIRDVENGTFSWVPQRKRFFVEMGCQMISLVNVGAVVLLTLVLSGTTTFLWREVLNLLLYSLCVAAFAMLLRRLTFGIRGLSMITPLLVVVMLVVCPVFFDLGALRTVQYLLPATYWINGAYHSKYLLLMSIYTVLALTMSRLLDYRRKDRC